MRTAPSATAPWSGGESTAPPPRPVPLGRSSSLQPDRSIELASRETGAVAATHGARLQPDRVQELASLPPDPPGMRYLPDHPGLPGTNGASAVAPRGAKPASRGGQSAHVDPPSMGYFPASPPPPRMFVEEETPPLAAPRAPVIASRLPPPG
jgi:hypothetical protein